MRSHLRRQPFAVAPTEASLADARILRKSVRTNAAVTAGATVVCRLEVAGVVRGVGQGAIIGRVSRHRTLAAVDEPIDEPAASGCHW